MVTLGDGFADGMPKEIKGVPSFVFQAQHVLPKFEVSGITSMPMPAKARRLVKSADVVHVHLVRDLVTLPFALIALQCGAPVVLQTHGMIDPTEKRGAQLVDVLGLRRVLHKADTALYLTEHERDAVQAVIPDTATR